MLQSVRIKPGEQLNISSGKYLIESIIGTGGFGTVFKASKNKKYYAIKLNRIWELLPGDREDIIQRIKQEFEISHSIQSSHIVYTYSYDEIHGNPILVMDYCSDGSLRKKIGIDHSVESINNLAIQILNGLSILHSFQIVHRDIKPENILFDSKIAKLTDFGISTNLNNRLTQTNIRGHALKIFATLAYSPPEQSQKSKAYTLTGPTNDIYSFGIIMYELITKGYLPFGKVRNLETDARKIEENKINGKWDTVSLKKNIKEDYWINIIRKCIYPDPDKRFQQIDDIIHILTRHQPNLLNEKSEWKLMILEGLEKGKTYNLSKLSQYKNKKILTIGRYDREDPFVNDILSFRYRYLNGKAVQVRLQADHVKYDKNYHINPSGGRFVQFKYTWENNDFLVDFDTGKNIGLEIYENYTFNRFELDWEEYFANPLFKNHAFSVRLQAGYIDRPVDDFFYLWAGGLLGMKGYSYFSIGGTRKFISSFTYRFPLFENIDWQIWNDAEFMGHWSIPTWRRNCNHRWEIIL